jgi:hypothetical protein
MRRLLTAAVLAVSLPMALTVVAGSAPAAAQSADSTHSTGTVTCTQLSGTFSGTAILSHCTPHSKGTGSLSGAASALLYGGTVTWEPAGRVMGLTVTVRSPGQGRCRAGSTEELASGSVTGGWTGHARAKSPVSIEACLTSVGSRLSLVKGSVARL